MSAPKKKTDKDSSAKAKHASDNKKAKDAKAEEQEITTEEAKSAAPLDERLLRLQADFDNYRKRVLREKDELYRRANEDIMEELLPVLDHLEMALGSVGEAHKNDPVVEGFRLVGEQLRCALGKFGLAAIDTDGEEFDPNLHEAIVHMPSEDVPENGLISAIRRGYKLGDRLLRASQVVVSSGAPTIEDGESSEED